jgi:hypothetical protein
MFILRKRERLKSFKFERKIYLESKLEWVKVGVKRKKQLGDY